MFILKKLVSMFLMPLSIGLLLLLTGFFFLLRKQTNRAILFIAAGILWISLFSYPPFANAFLSYYETQYPALLSIPKNTNYILVLGNGHRTDTTRSITSQVNPTAINRLSEGIRILHELPKATLIVSGYGGKDPNSHADMQRKLAIALGIDASRIITLPKPKDTKEEAIESKKIIGSQPFVLVTSASHMPRSVAIFKKEGMHPLPAPTNHLATKPLSYFELPSGEGLKKSEVAFHEFLGTIWYSIKGYI